MQPPSTATEARSFLGLLNTVARFVPNVAAMTEPIRRLTHKNAPWSWGPEQSEAFEKLCNLISGDTVLAHLDPSLPTQVRHDACKIGISGAQNQKHPDRSIRPVAFASRSLSPIEQRYSQTPCQESGRAKDSIFTFKAASLTWLVIKNLWTFS